MGIGTKKSQWTKVEEFRWVLENRYPNRVMIDSGVIPHTQEAFSKLDVELTFSGVAAGRPIALSDLFTPNSYWTAQFDHDTGSVIITALQNLGLMQFHQKMHGPANIKYGGPLVDEYVVMEYYPSKWLWPFASRHRSVPHEIHTYSPTVILQKQIRFAVSRPEDASTVALSTESGPEPAPVAAAAPAPQAAPPMAPPRPPKPKPDPRRKKPPVRKSLPPQP